MTFLLRKKLPLFFLCLFGLSSIIPLFLPSSKIHAANEWTDSQGNHVTNYAWSTNFIFQDTQTIIDKNTGQKYLTASIPAFDLSREDNNKYDFMYWPVDASGAIIDAMVSPTTGGCRGGFWIAGGKINYVNTTLDANTSKCVVGSTALSSVAGNIKDSPLKAYVQAATFNVYAMTTTELEALASPFYWKNKINIVLTGYNTNLYEVSSSDALNNAGVLKKLQDGLNSADPSNKYAAPHSSTQFFSTTNCLVNNGSALSAALIVNPASPGVGYVVHYQDNDVNKSMAIDWKEDQQRCLFGNSSNIQYSHNPYSQLPTNDSPNDPLVFLSQPERAKVDPTAADQDQANQGSGSSIADSGGASDTQVDCESGFTGANIGAFIDGAISWIMCPLIDGAQAIVRGVGDAVVDQLIVNVDVLEGTDTGSKQTAVAIHSAWNDFRIISLSLLILIALVGIGAGSFIDAYTIKKILPRMLIALIAITLSWDLMKLALDVTNAVGTGVSSLIETPFRSLPNATIDPSLIFAGLGAGGAIFGLLGLFSFMATAALAVIVAFIVVSIRYVAIIAFIIMAPVAIMASILPGTQKAWKIWHEGLSGALMMLPIVTGMLAIGASLGKVVGQVQQGPFGQLMALIVTYGPYFIIPKAFSMAGGLIGNLSGMANDRGRGAFDRIKKFRQNEAHKAWERKKGGNTFRSAPEKSLRGRLNRGIQGATMANELGFNPKRWKENMTQAMGEREATESEDIMKSAVGRMLQDDDIASALVDANGDEAAFRRILQERAYKRFGGDENRGALDLATAGAMRLSKKYGAGAVRVAALRSKFNSSTGWNNEWEYETDQDGSFKLDEKGEKIIAKDEHGNNKVWKYTAAGEMLQDINKVAGSNRILSTQLLAEARAGQSRAGREDTGGGGFSDTAVEMDKLYRGDAAKDESGKVITYTDKNGQQQVQAYNIEMATEKVTESLINGKPIHEIFRSGKPAVARAVAPVMMKMTQRSLKASADRAQKAVAAIEDNGVWSPDEKAKQIEVVKERQAQESIRAVAQEQMMHAVAASSSTEAAQVMGDKVFTQPFPMDSLPDSVRQKIEKVAGPNPTRGQAYEALRDDPTWGAYVKEYGVRNGRIDPATRIAALQAEGMSAEEARIAAATEERIRAAAEQNQQGQLFS